MDIGVLSVVSGFRSRKAVVKAQSPSTIPVDQAFCQLTLYGGDSTNFPGCLPAPREPGVPFCLYAASRLLEQRSEYQRAIDALQAVFAGNRPLAPPAWYLLRAVAKQATLAAGEAVLQEKAASLVQTADAGLLELEQVLALQREFPRLMSDARAIAGKGVREPFWLPCGKEPWLYSVEIRFDEMDPCQ